MPGREAARSSSARDRIRKRSFRPPLQHRRARNHELLFERLADRGPALNTLGDSGYVPRLARRWEWSADSLRVTFHLDPPARWEDGRPVTADDVKFGFAVYTDSLVGSRARADLLALVDSISVVDPLTCTAWFRRRTPEQFDALVTTLMPLPAHLLGTSARLARDVRVLAQAGGRRTVPAGGVAAAGQPRARAERLVRRPTTSAGPGDLDVRPEQSTLLKQFLAGETDFLENLSVDDAGAVARQPDTRVIRLGNYGYNFLTFNLRDGASDRPHPIFGDRAVRRALTMALDRSLLVRSVFDSLGRIGLGPFVRVQWSADTALAQIPFDRAAAAHLLDSLGWRTGADGVRARNGRPLAFTLLVPTTSAPRKAFAVLIQEQLRLAGVKVAIALLDGNAMIDRVRRHELDAAMWGVTATPSPSGVKQTWTSAAAGTADSISAGTRARVRRGGRQRRDRDHETARARPLPRRVPDHRGRRAGDLAVRAAAPGRREHAAALGTIRADAWWMGLPGWSIAPGGRLPRDARPRPHRSGVRRFLLARGAQAVVVVALVATLAFALVHLAPGDPFGASLDDPSNTEALHAQQMHRWGYDRPIAVQYVRWIGNLARGELGWSHSRNRPVAEVLLDTVPRTLLLMGTALVAGVLAGVALGTWQAARKGGPPSAQRARGRGYALGSRVPRRARRARVSGRRVALVSGERHRRRRQLTTP